MDCIFANDGYCDDASSSSWTGSSTFYCDPLQIVQTVDGSTCDDSDCMLDYNCSDGLDCSWSLNGLDDDYAWMDFVTVMIQIVYEWLTVILIPVGAVLGGTNKGGTTGGSCLTDGSPSVVSKIHKVLLIITSLL